MPGYSHWCEVDLVVSFSDPRPPVSGQQRGPDSWGDYPQVTRSTTTRPAGDQLVFAARPGARDADVTLFCFPYAGGSTMVYRGWAERLGPRIQARPAALPGRELRVRESPAIDPAQLALALAGAADRPYAIYGHSMGARLTLDVVQELIVLGAPLPERIIVGGCRPPHRELLTRVAHLPDEQFMHRVAAMGGMSPQLFADSELRAILLPVLRSDFAMIESHPLRAAEPLPVPITAVAGIADAQADAADMVGWAAHTRAGFELYTLPGEHFFVHSEKPALLDLLESVLAGAGNERVLTLPLSPDEVLVVDARLDDMPGYAAAREELSAAEGRRADSLRDPRNADRFAARSVLQRRLCAAHGLDVGRSDFVAASGGKPTWPSENGVRFNASHSDGIALLAFSRDRELGVDVERVSPMADLDAFVSGALDAGEREEFEALAGGAALDYALRIWTAKEATLKFTGDGLKVEPDAFGFAGHQGLSRWQAATDPGLERLAEAEIRHLDLVDAIGALAVPVDAADIRLRFATVPGGGR